VLEPPLLSTFISTPALHLITAHDLDLWPFDLRVNARRATAMNCMSTKFGVGSSSRFPFGAQTHRFSLSVSTGDLQPQNNPNSNRPTSTYESYDPIRPTKCGILIDMSPVCRWISSLTLPADTKRGLPEHTRTQPRSPRRHWWPYKHTWCLCRWVLIEQHLLIGRTCLRRRRRSTLLGTDQIATERPLVKSAACCSNCYHGSNSRRTTSTYVEMRENFGFSKRRSDVWRQYDSRSLQPGWHKDLDKHKIYQPLLFICSFKCLKV